MSVDTKRNAQPDGRVRTVRNPVDVHIGNQVRLKRIAVGQSKEELSQILGVTIRQLRSTRAARTGSAESFAADRQDAWL